MAHTSSRLIVGLLTAGLLAGCTNSESNGRFTLPQQFQLRQSQFGTLFEQKSGMIAIARRDGNVIVVDQTGKTPIELTRDAGMSVLKDRSGVVLSEYVLPMWSPDASQLALIETRSAYPMTLATTFQGNLSVFGQADPRSSVQDQTVAGSVGREITETERFTFQPNRVTVEFGGEHVASAVYMVAPTGKAALKEVLYTDDQIEFLDWSPNGDQVAVLASSQSGQTLSLMSPDGSRKQDVVTGSFVRWNWHPDGTTMLTQWWASPSSPRLSIDVQATDNGEKLASVDAGRGVGASATQFSPDGKSMIIVKPAEVGTETLDMLLADRDGNVQRKLTTVSGIVSYAWSPRSDRVAFVVRDTPGSSGGVLRVLDIASGEARLLSTTPVAGFFWSPDGTRIAVFSPIDLASFDATTSVPAAISEQSANPMLVATIDVAAGPSSTRPLFYVEPTVRFMGFVAQSDRFSRAMTIWSPNSRNLVVAVRLPVSQNAMADYVIESEATGSIFPRILGEGSLAVWSPK
jgi:dipeptidyl aminopeptidase/acylaminoacyl peptidase